ENRIDVTATDAYWWWLLERHDPQAARSYRAIGETASAPIPPLICSAALAPSFATALVTALAEVHKDRRAAAHLDALGMRRFAAVERADNAPPAEARPRTTRNGLPAAGLRPAQEVSQSRVATRHIARPVFPIRWRKRA